MEKTQNNSDRELFHLVAEGDEQAFGQLYFRYVALLYPYATSLLKSESTAEEVVQETMLRVWLKRDQLPQIEQPRAWIFRIAANCCLNHFRRRGVELRAVKRITQEKEQEQLDQPDAVRFSEIKKVIGNAVDKLSPQRKLIYRLSREEGMTIPEIAQRLGLAPDTVKKTLMKALELVRAELTSKGFHLSLFMICLIF